MGERDRAEMRGHSGKEYWSARAGRGVALSWGKIGKWITHRKERAVKRREEYRAITEDSD